MSEQIKVAVAGFGAIGLAVAEALDAGSDGSGGIEGLECVAVAARDIPKAEARMAGFARPLPVRPFTERYLNDTFCSPLFRYPRCGAADIMGNAPIPVKDKVRIQPKK